MGDAIRAVGDLGVGPPDDRWDGRSVLVTGAAGFLGGAVVRDLSARGARVVGVDIAWDTDVDDGSPTVANGDLRVDGDIRDSGLVAYLLAEQGLDTVFHLAAKPLVEDAVALPAETFSNNVEGTWSVLEACRTAPTSVQAIVVASSDKAYGDWAGRPYDERMALRPRHPYEASKAAADLIAQSYAATFAMPVAITRCGNLYGGGDLNWSRIVPGTIRAVLAGERPVIRSDGSFVRDYLHVRDAARAVRLLASAVAQDAAVCGQAFNFASGMRLRVDEVVSRILALMESDLEPIVRGGGSDEIREQRVSSARARRELGWRAEVGIDEGLREAIGWYRRHLARP